MKTIIIDGVEYNLTPKIMFKNGTWLVENEPNNYARFIQILEVVDVQGKERYRFSRDLHNDEDELERRFIENNYHSFTIQDAKDGDVLISKYGNIGVFQKNDDFTWTSYFSLGYNGGFQDFKVEHENEKTYPATKEQRDTLLKSMADAGYTFDFEKKELKKL